MRKVAVLYKYLACYTSSVTIPEALGLVEETRSQAAARLPLRARNVARLRLRVLRAVLDLTAERSFADVSVREICEAVEVSQGTFFNHFPGKDAVLVYYINLWSLRAAARARAAAAAGPAWDALRAVFAYTADEIEAHPSVMLEIITLVAQAKAPPAPLPISRAERLLAFPDVADVEALEPRPIGALVAEAVELARARGELPPTTDAVLATRLLVGLFYGLPLATRRAGAAAIRPAYEAGLTLILAALGGAPRPIGPPAPAG
jgi:AcrR family transcriptional regulator